MYVYSCFVWPARLKLFTIWPFTEKFCQTLLQTVVSQGGAMFVLFFIVIHPWPGACTEQVLNGDTDACFFDN